MFNMYQQYEQIGSKQLFICSNPIGMYKSKILVSYRTVVGYYDAVQCTWILTKHKYSVTTSKQLTQFAREHNVTWLDEKISN